MHPDLVVISAEPLNAETPLSRQVGTITPVGRHYVRSHFATPRPPERLLVDGLVRQALALTLDELRAMPSRSEIVTIECAGNGRGFLEPPAPGEQWGLGAVGTAEWTGVPLREVLRRAEVLPGAREVQFRGADAGMPPDAGGRIAFERSLTVELALRDGPLLAYAMNGEDLTPEHGAPLRLVVPGLYGMASVKWLDRIAVTSEDFEGYFQRERYVIDGEPLGAIAPRAVIVAPPDLGSVPRGPLAVRGYAWSGGAPVHGVEVSVDGGRTWRDAELGEERSPYAWREWQLVWDAPRGEHALIARAVTSTGAKQPLEARRTALGYANNGALVVRVTAV